MTDDDYKLWPDHTIRADKDCISLLFRLPRSGHPTSVTMGVDRDGNVNMDLLRAKAALLVKESDGKA
jgi:hypothetical protein